MRVDNDVLAVLSQAELSGHELRLTGQLDRKMYVSANKVLEAAGGKWNRKAKAHLFDRPAVDRVEEIILTGEVEVPKDEFNYFPTPPDVVAQLMERAAVHSGMRVLEPSAGTGAIAFTCADVGAIVDCYELMEANFKGLVGDSRLGLVKHLDFLTQSPEAVYDRVVMNPPFAKQADIHHVTHALKFLKPGGRLVSVMAGGITFRENRLTQDFRALVVAHGGDIEALPEGAFKSSGTMVRSVIVTIDR